ncbi:YciI family protein [Nocardioides litoris]|uniref:YciI family protein n=1 Tax=Nocardioides litoris TaxID=1926648 RepID=UPI0011217194|nr:YciI family protein [Nocardioides litoris]
MPQYVIYFNQQWVGDHPAEWFESRGPLASAVVEEIRAAGELVVAGGLVEDDARAAHADATSGSLVVRDGAYAPHEQRVGGLTIVDVADDQAARTWAGRIAEACGWPQEVRQLW